jgi:CheY-like chemotaxis protein
MKKILVLDDQQLVLMSLKKMLSDLNYSVTTTQNAKDTIHSVKYEKFDLILIDINLGEKNQDGFNIIQQIKLTQNKETPIFILSGQTDDDSIIKGYNLGIIDFIKKPLSKIEIQAKISNFFGETNDLIKSQNNSTLHDVSAAVVIPCYNEEERLQSEHFLSFLDKNIGYKLCFVNDGSKDKTLEVLKKIQKGREHYIIIYNCLKNGGKAESVRQGMLYMAKEFNIDFVGFLDADLSTNFADFIDLVDTIKKSDFKIVSGSRIARMGADIYKESSRAFISKTINYIIRKTLKMDFQDTQCGAKVMRKDLIKVVFDKPFYTKMLFDVEIFMRIRNKYGLEKAKSMLCEQPLKKWVHMDGSKLSFNDSIKIIGQIAQIALKYKI